MKKILLVLIVFLFCVTGCGKTQETLVNSESNLSEEEQEKKNIYDEALNLAYDGDFYGAIQKLNELSESYLDSKELIALLKKDVDSPFIGTWYCSRANSCNDMSIALKIYPVYQYGEIQLSFERDMKSPTGTGSSNITGTINMPTSNTTTVYNLNNAKWTISGNTLKEVFTGDKNKTNTYNK